MKCEHVDIFLRVFQIKILSILESLILFFFFLGRFDVFHSISKYLESSNVQISLFFKLLIVKYFVEFV